MGATSKVLKRPAAALAADEPRDEKMAELRDRIKARKFKEFWDAMPDHIQQAFNKAGTHAPSLPKSSTHHHVSVCTQNMFADMFAGV